MMTKSAELADIARELEAELEEYPDQRGEILVEAANQYHWAGHSDRALAGRRRVRETLGLPPDELDESVLDMSNLADALTPPPQPPETRILFWPREEIPRAHEAWPQLVEHRLADTVSAEREAANRELSASGVTRITMVPLTTARLMAFAERTGCDPTEESTRLACMNEIVDDGGTISWPPARNGPCWCGSAINYKKCCGRPGQNSLFPTSHASADMVGGLTIISTSPRCPNLSAAMQGLDGIRGTSFSRIRDHQA